MPATEGQDALSQQAPATSLCPRPNTDIIISGSEREARIEIANTLENLVNALNTYISRKGL